MNYIDFDIIILMIWMMNKNGRATNNNEKKKDIERLAAIGEIGAVAV